jgi:hypothetical protein
MTDKTGASDGMVKNPSQYFSVTGIPPSYLDFSAEYPVLAIIIRYTHTGVTSGRLNQGRLSTSRSTFHEIPIYTKETFFLVADKKAQFKWVSQAESSFFTSALPAAEPQHKNTRLIRYSLNKDVGEGKNMIYPVRAFSITGIKMDGFEEGKEYPVLAIDMDQYIQENQENEGLDLEDQQPTQSMAFFLVGDDNGEFTWIAEEECKLYPLKD